MKSGSFRRHLSKRGFSLAAALVFVSVFALTGFLALKLGEGLSMALAVGILVGGTAAIEVAWFGGRAFFSKRGPDG